MEAMEVKRLNRMGREYKLRQELEYDNTLTGRTVVWTGLKSMVMDHTIEKINQGWYNWIVKGMMVQDAFDFLTVDEREFIMSGMTADEWEKMFPEKEVK